MTAPAIETSWPQGLLSGSRIGEVTYSKFPRFSERAIERVGDVLREGRLLGWDDFIPRRSWKQKGRFRSIMAVGKCSLVVPVTRHSMARGPDGSFAMEMK